MIAVINHKGKEYKTDLLNPIDISLPLHTGEDCVSAWYVKPMILEPVRMGEWVGDVNQGAGVNFRNVFFNPHGNGTHTECVGHISKEFITINTCLKRFLFIAELVTINLEKLSNGDFVLSKKEFERALGNLKPEAIIIRTVINGIDKNRMHYSNTNPPYITADAMRFLTDAGIEHLLIDLPSVDKEEDGGVLEAHHIFWQYPQNTQFHKTITEFIYVPNEISDGTYILNIQIASFENDASPSKPVLYKIM